MRCTCFIFSLGISLSSLSVFSQSKIGIKAGYNMANMAIREKFAPETQYMSSFHIGILKEFDLNRLFSIQPNLMFSGKGFRNNNSELQFKETLYYLELPLLLMAKTNERKGIRYMVGIGPSVGVGLFGVYRSTYEGYKYTQFFLFDKSEQQKFPVYQRFDWGMMAGIGIEIHNRWQCMLNYELGISNIDPAQIKSFRKNNRAFLLSVAYLFTHAKKG